MKYTLVFSMLGLCLAYLAAGSAGIYAGISWYGAVNLFFLAAVYGLRNPYLLGKRPDGRLAWLPCLVNLPWLTLSYVTWLLQSRLSREPATNEVPGEDLVIGRRLLPTEYPDGIDAVIDLTSELPERHGRVGYIAFPMLDGVAPRTDVFEQVRQVTRGLEGKRVYVHCAQGHGRTALFCSIMLAIRNGVSTGAAYERLLEVRPRARMSREQLAYLRSE